MNRFATAVGITVMLLTPALCYARHGKTANGNDATILANCPVQGDAKLPQVQALNQLKRRMRGSGLSR